MVADNHPKDQEAIDEIKRQKRVSSHALIEIRKYKYLPFICHSGVLLDISVGGFKMEFTGEVLVTPGQTYWINIPLSPLKIYAPKKLQCKVEVRWFDALRFRIGGIFLDLNRTDALLIDQIVSSLSAINHQEAS